MAPNRFALRPHSTPNSQFASVIRCAGMKKSGNDKKVAKNVAKALAEVPIDNKQERDALRARLRQKYDDLERLRRGMKEDDRKRFDEIGELIDELDKCESRAVLPRA